MTEAGAQEVSSPTLAPPAPEQAAPPKRGLYSLQSLAGTIVIAVFVITFVVQAFQIPSESMEKTLLIGDYLLVDKAHYGESRAWSWMMPYRRIRRQDIIVFRYPVNPSQHFVKRVIAVPGDRVRLVNKHVYVDGVRQDDSFATFKSAWHDSFRDEFPDGGLYGERNSSSWFAQAQRLTEQGALIVPDDCYFVMGDNRDDSYDSRYWGFVPRENIVGRPLMIYWSMNRDNTAMARGLPSDRLSSLTLNVTQWLSSLRVTRILRIPQ